MLVDEQLSIYTSHGRGQSLIGSSVYEYANVVIKDGILVGYEPIANQMYSNYNAAFRPTPNHGGTPCDPIYIGTMRKWIDYMRNHIDRAKDINFYENDNGYVVNLNCQCCVWFMTFNRDGLLHSHDGPALRFGNFRSIWAVNGEYMPGRLNDYYDNDYQQSIGEINVDDLGYVVQKRLESTNIKTIVNYLGPAYVYGEYHNVDILTDDGVPFTELY